MAERDKNYTANFLNGILSQPVLNEELTQGFASRKLKDQGILSNIIKSQRIDTNSLLNKPNEHIPRKDKTSKVDRIIADFLDKVKKRGIQHERNYVTTKENFINIEEPHSLSNKLYKANDGPLKYFENISPTSNYNTRANIFIPEIADNALFPENNNFDFQDNRSTISTRHPLFLKNPYFIDLKSKKYTKPSTDNEYYRKDIILSQKRKTSPKICKYNRFQNNFIATRNIPLRSSQSLEKKLFNFPCNDISPIEYCQPQASQVKSVYGNIPNAFSTPLQKEFVPHNRHSFLFDSISSVQSVSTQTECSHNCLLCSSPSYKKTYRNKIDYLFEE